MADPMHPLLRLLVPTLLVVAALAEPAGVLAQGTDDDALARNHFVVARRYFEEARYAEAAHEFSEAYRLSGRVELLLNLALAQERALQYEEAIGSLESYLEQSPNATDRADVQERIERLRALQDAEEARVRERAAALAAARAGGEPAPAATPAPAAATATDPEPSGDGGGLTGLQWAGVGLLAGGAALGGAAVGTGVAAQSVHDDLEESQAANGGVVPEDQAGDIDRGRSLAAASTALTFVAAAAGIAGVVLLLVGGGSGDDDASDDAALRPRIRVGVSPWGGFASAEVPFR